MKRVAVIALAVMLLVSACAEKNEIAEKPVVDRNKTEEISGTPLESGDEAEAEPDPHGVTENGIYKNEYFALCFAPEGDWSFFSEDELTALGESESARYDMYAVGDGGLVTVNAVIEDVGEKNAYLYDEEGYADVSLELVEAAERDESFTLTSADKVKSSLAGAEHFAVKTHGEYALDEWRTAEVWQLAVCDKNGRYVAIVTLTSFFEDKTADLAEFWRAE